MSTRGRSQPTSNTVRAMEVVELYEITPQQWGALEDGEREPWGGLAEELAWANKQRHVGLRAADGQLVAIAGALIAEIEVEGVERFDVVGVGSVFVTARERGHGLARTLLDSLLRIAEGMGPERAMLFCRPQLMALYGTLAFAEIHAPVSAQQPDGEIEMPLRAMWRPLREGSSWPEGRVKVLGLPF
jgi:GNAT superfamily N-acetyltransferase